MKNLIRKLSRVADSSQYRLFSVEKRAADRPDSLRKRTAGVPEGHLAVYVGEEMERFVISADLLNQPIFAELLSRSAAEYGYEQRGGLRIPCRVWTFERVLETLRLGRGEFLAEELLD
ncbi:hypothetical protein M569_14106, partial [Genlisea aurea]